MVTMKEAETEFQAYKAELKEIEDKLHRFGATARRLQRKRQHQREEEEEDDTPVIQSVIIRKSKSARVGEDDRELRHTSPENDGQTKEDEEKNKHKETENRHRSKKEDTHTDRDDTHSRRDSERNNRHKAHTRDYDNEESGSRRKSSTHDTHKAEPNEKDDAKDMEIEEGEVTHDGIAQKPKPKGPVLPTTEDMASISQARAARISQGEGVADKTRNRRLFGALMGTIGGTSRNRVVVGGRRVSKQQDEELIKKRQEIEKRITEKTSQQSKIEEEEILQLLQQKEDTAEKMYKLSEEVEANRVQQVKFQHYTDLGNCEFIRVKATPHIFYKPVKHNKTTLKLLERSRKAILAERPEDTRAATIVIRDERQGEAEDNPMETEDHSGEQVEATTTKQHDTDTESGSVHETAKEDKAEGVHNDDDEKEAEDVTMHESADANAEESV